MSGIRPCSLHSYSSFQFFPECTFNLSRPFAIPPDPRMGWQTGFRLPKGLPRVFRFSQIRAEVVGDVGQVPLGQLPRGQPRRQRGRDQLWRRGTRRRHLGRLRRTRNCPAHRRRSRFLQVRVTQIFLESNHSYQNQPINVWMNLLCYFLVWIVVENCHCRFVFCLKYKFSLFSCKSNTVLNSY